MWPIQGRAAGQGMVSMVGESVLNRVFSYPG